jgi:hypothetical protein
MKPALNPACERPRGYLLTEALVYMGLLFVVLGLGYLAIYRYIDHSMVLRRSTEDISRALSVGERWRSDVRSADAKIRLENTDSAQFLYLADSQGDVAYRFSDGAVSRRVGSGPWSIILTDVKSSSMDTDRRQQVTAWRWELELQPRAKASVKAGRVRPLFTFSAAQPSGPKL